jgi:superfamily II DNA/RNA helicase
MEREDRAAALSSFQRGVKRILIATDIGEDGMVYNNLDVVVNFDFPKTAASYIKRALKVNRKGGYSNYLSTKSSIQYGTKA